ncbi:MAG: hypothetical protein HZC55_20360 [Verrucomicrobia bacterium]|nr:hypothetical protein [Verrucomicrobiota bacterium]
MKLGYRLTFTTLCLAGALGLNANTLLVDRGLPTANLNNAAGANRSNVAWAYDVKSNLNNYWLVGDTFTNTTGSNYHIDTIRLWSVGATDLALLWGGVAGDPISLLPSTASISTALYSGGSTYQGSAGGPISMYQLDFAVNINLGAGQTYNFFLDGSRSTSPFVPFAHAANAALAGSLQQGADNSMLGLNIVNGVASTLESWTSLGNGWDKASDVNVQVFGTVPDSASAVLLVAMGLVALALGRRRL